MAAISERAIANQKECHRKWRAKNREKLVLLASQNYQRNAQVSKDRSVVWHRENKAHAATLSRIRHLKRHYGITPEQYDAILEAQGHRCATCGTDTPSGNGHWHVDHCHDTNVVRSILCHGCNTSLGQLKEVPETFASLMVYLAAHGKPLSPDTLRDFLVAYPIKPTRRRLLHRKADMTNQ